jgi:hypothetical protein
MEDKFITTKVKFLQGAVGNTEWWTDKDWEEHWEYVERLKASGEYLKETEVTVTLKYNPLFDDPPDFKVERDSVGIYLLDFGV